MQGILYEENSVWLFLLVTVVMGGSASWAAGRAIARTWRPYLQVIAYMLLLGGAVRFIHFALFGGTLSSFHFYLVDTAFLMVAGSLGFRHARTEQMTRQYRWLYVRTGPFTWADRGEEEILAER
jgi:hypothetical protein